MKKTLLILTALGSIASAKAQVSAYTFSQSSGTYTPITGGTVVVAASATGADDFVYTAQPIGFTFNYNGTNYTDFGVSTNGYIWFGTGSASTTTYTPISSATLGTGTIDGAIAGLGRNILKRTAVPQGELRIETIGVAPNRLCVVQFSNWRGFALGTGVQYNFQIVLQETSNIIYLNYGAFTMTGATASSDFQIGLRGTSNTDFNNVVASAANWTGAISGGTNSSSSTLSTTVFPSSGTIFQFTPPAPCSGTPTAGTAVSSTTLACTGTGFNLSLTGASSGVSGLSYQWLSSADGVTFAPIGGATSANYSATQTDTTWYSCVVTCTTSGQDDTSTIVQVNMNNFINCYCTPTYTTGTGSGDYLSLVSLDSINNATLGSTAPYYTLYTTPSTTLLLNTTYNLTVSPGTYTINDIAAWIDFNHDGLFDASEKLGEVYNMGAAPATTVFTFLVPLTASLGETVLRVREADQGSTSLDPCLGYAYGETEDYRISIAAAPPCTTPPVAGTITGTANDTIGQTGMYVITGSTGNIQWYVADTTTGPWTPIVGGSNDTLNYTYNAVGDFYFTAILSNPGCDNDTASAIMTTIILPGDNACDAIDLSFGVNGAFSNSAATQQTGEPMPPLSGCEIQSGWCDDSSTPDNSMWFTFTAPASGRVTIQVPEFDARLAIWKATTCADLTSGGATLVAANDDDPNYTAHGGAMFSPYIDSVYCLVPGTKYFVQVDGYGTATDSFTVVLTDPGFIDTTFSGLSSTICYVGGEVDTLVPSVAGGIFTGIGLTDSLFYADTAGLGTFTITYTLYTCYSSSQTVVVGGFPLVDLGNDTTACVNYTINAGNPGATYNWSTGATTQTINVTSTNTYSVEVTNAAGCSSSDTLVVTIDPCLSVNELTNTLFEMYPNPANTNFTIVSPYTGSIRMIGLNGQEVLNSALNGKLTIDLNSVANGVYNVIVTTENGTSSKRLIVNK